MGLPAITCPCCNVAMPLEAVFAHQGARDAFLALAGLHPSQRLAMTALRYIGLFAPARQAMRWDRIADLMNEIRELVSSGRVSWKHQEHAAPLDYWISAMETMLADPVLRRPLSSHNYLKAIVAGMGERVEARAEQRDEDARAGRTPVGAPRREPATPAPPKPRMAPEAAREKINQFKQKLTKGA